MMKYTKTAIGLLTRQYRSVLKKCWLINVGLFALGAPVIAAITASDAEAAVENIKMNGAVVAPEGTTVDLGDVIKDVKLNGSSLVRTNGSVNINALTGFQINGNSVSSANGITNLAVTSSSAGVITIGGQDITLLSLIHI